MINDCDAFVSLLNRTNGKWSPTIIRTLYHGPRRYNKIRQLIRDISSTQLSRSLKILALNKVIFRRVDGYYELADDVRAIINSVELAAKKNM